MSETRLVHGLLLDFWNLRRLNLHLHRTPASANESVFTPHPPSCGVSAFPQGPSLWGIYRLHSHLGKWRDLHSRYLLLPGQAFIYLFILMSWIFPEQGSNPSPLSGRRILKHWMTRAVPRQAFLLLFLQLGPFLLLPLLWERILISTSSMRTIWHVLLDETL